MAKKEISKKAKEPNNEDIRISKFGIDMSKIIESWFKANPHITKTEIAQKLYVTKMGFNHRLRTPYFGNAFDLLELCLATKFDFFQPFINALKNNGLAVKEVYTDQQLHQIRSENIALESALKRLNRENDMLYARIQELEAKIKDDKVDKS